MLSFPIVISVFEGEGVILCLPYLFCVAQGIAGAASAQSEDKSKAGKEGTGCPESEAVKDP